MEPRVRVPDSRFPRRSPPVVAMLSAWAIVLPAVIAVALAVAGPAEQVGRCLLASGVVIGLLVAVRRGVSRGVATLVGVGIGADVALTWLIERSLSLSGPVSAEVWLLSGLRGALLGLLIRSREQGCGFAAAAAPFILLSATAVADPAYRGGLLLLGTAGGTIYLLAHYGADRWRRSGVHLSPATAAVVLVCVSVIGATTWARVDREEVAMRLRGWLPSSGGEVDGSDRARSGIGEGPDRLSGSDNPDSTGFDEGETFVNSEEPTLYDAFVEMIGEARKPRDTQQLLSLDPNKIRTSPEQFQQDLRSGKKLDLRRTLPAGRNTRRDRRSADGLFFVSAPGPLHLRFALYDQYEQGGVWTNEQVHSGIASLRNDANWMHGLDLPISPALSSPVPCQVRVGEVNTSTLPLPPNTAAFSLGLVDQRSWFSGSLQSMVRMRMRRLPPGAVLEVRCSPLDLRRQHADPPLRTHKPPRHHPALLDLASQWTSGIEPGWAQIHAVVGRLAAHAATVDGYAAPTTRLAEHAVAEPVPHAHAGHAAAPRGEAVHLALPDGVDLVEQFLFVTRRGGSPEFASATALLLRSLGYHTRIAAGFYAHRDQQDPRSRLVAVTSAHVHVWVEVATESGAWIVVDPTPGYEVLTAAPGRLDAAADLLGAVAARWTHWSPPVLLVAGMVLFRHRLLNLGGTLWLRLRVLGCKPGRQRELVMSAVRLLELRSRIAGRPRQRFVTYGRFFRSAGHREMGELAEWATYAPHYRRAPMPENVVRSVLDAALRRLTVQHLRNNTSPPSEA